MRSTCRRPPMVTVTVCPTCPADPPERGCAEHDLAAGTGRAARKQGGRQQRPPACGHPDRRNDHTADPDRPVVANVQPVTPGAQPNCSACGGVRLPNCISTAASQVCPYRRGVCTRWSRLAPKVNAAVTASTDKLRRPVRCVPARRFVPGQARVRGALPWPPSLARRHPPATRRPSTGQPALPPLSRRGRPTRGAGPAAPPWRRQHHDGNCSGREHRRVHADPGVRLGQAGCPDRHQRRCRYRQAGRGHRTGRGRGHAHLEQAAAISWPRVIPSAASTGLAVRHGQQPRGGLPDDEKRGDVSTRAKSASATASGRMARSILRPAHARPRRHIFALHAGEPARECLCAAAELQRGARPQPHSRPVDSYVARGRGAAEAALARMTGNLSMFGDRLHRSARDDDADHPFPQLAGYRRPAPGLSPGWLPSPACCQPAHARRPPRAGRGRSRPGDPVAAAVRRAPWDVDQVPRPAVIHRRRPTWLSQRAARSGRRHGRPRRHRAAGPAPGSSRPGRPRRRNQHVGRLRGLKEARVGAVCPPRPRGRGQDAPPATATSTASTAQPRHRARSSCAAR